MRRHGLVIQDPLSSTKIRQVYKYKLSPNISARPQSYTSPSTLPPVPHLSNNSSPKPNPKIYLFLSKVLFTPDTPIPNLIPK